MKPSDKKRKTKPSNGGYSIGEIAYLFLSRWYWFVLTISITVGWAVYKTLTTQPIYTRYTQVQINSSDKSNNLSEQMENFATLGGYRNSTDVYNEIYAFKAPETIKETARRLKLYMEYESQGRFHKNTLYGENLPAMVNLLNIGNDSTASLNMDISPDGSFKLYNFRADGISDNTAVNGDFKEDSITLVCTPLGDIILEQNKHCRFDGKMTIGIRHIGLSNAASKLGGKLNFKVEGEDDSKGGNSKGSDIITISINDPSIERADDILEMLVHVYNENWIKDKNKTASGTEEFINKRLSSISMELDTIESSISVFKSDNMLPDIASSIQSKMAKEKSAGDRASELKNELEMAEFILKGIRDKANKNNLLPINSGIKNTNINSQINKYNSLMLERNSLVSKSSEDNPSVKNADVSLSSMRNAIITSMDTYIRHIKAQLGEIDKELGQIRKEIAKTPEQATFLESAERELTIKEKIYMFLLQKQAENQLSQAFTAYNTRIITPPTGSDEPTFPQGNRTILMALLAGFLIPAIIIVIKEVTNTKVRGRKDLDAMTVPIVGEIPKVSKKTKGNKKAKGKEKLSVVVEHGNRNVINEAFRVLRTNIEFMSRNKKEHVFTFTSFNPGSGKTFCILNTAISLALKNEKVLIIDGDMRHASLSNHVFSPDKGLSNYLAKEFEDPREAIITDSTYPTLHIMPVGTNPPNPTELLENGRFGEMIEMLKSEYKYILIDCPPIDIIADTHIIERHATGTFFLVRTGMLERSMLEELENIYTEGKLKNMAVIINSVEAKGSRYGYRYGYKYGYHYGSYNYGSKKTSNKTK